MLSVHDVAFFLSSSRLCRSGAYVHGRGFGANARADRCGGRANGTARALLLEENNEKKAGERERTKALLKIDNKFPFATPRLCTHFGDSRKCSSIPSCASHSAGAAGPEALAAFNYELCDDNRFWMLPIACTRVHSPETILMKRSKSAGTVLLAQYRSLSHSARAQSPALSLSLPPYYSSG